MFGFIGKAIKGIKLWGDWKKLTRFPKNWSVTMGDGGMVTVPVKSAAKSKINFGAVALLILGLLQMAGVHIDDTVKQNFGDAVGMIAQVFQSVILPVLIIIWRTWFNNTVTPAAGGGA